MNANTAQRHCDLAGKTASGSKKLHGQIMQQRAQLISIANSGQSSPIMEAMEKQAQGAGRNRGVRGHRKVAVQALQPTLSVPRGTKVHGFKATAKEKGDKGAGKKGLAANSFG